MQESRTVSGSFNPVNIGEDIVVAMKYSMDDKGKSIFGTAKKGDTEVGRISWATGTRLYINVEPHTESADALEIAQTFVAGLEQVLSL